MAVKLKIGGSPRMPLGQQSPAFLNKYFKYNMIDQSTPSTTSVPGALVGVLPAYSIPLQAYIRVNTAFANGDLKIGTTSDASTLCSTADLLSGTTGLYVVDRYMGTFSTVDVTFYAATGTSGATAGDADIFLTYIPIPNPTTY